MVPIALRTRALLKPTICYSLEIHNQSAATRADDNLPLVRQKSSSVSDIEVAEDIVGDQTLSEMDDMDELSNAFASLGW